MLTIVSHRFAVRRILFFAMSVNFMVNAAVAQRPLYRFEGDWDAMCLGASLRFAGDIDQDGWEDLIASAPLSRGSDGGRVIVFSGRTQRPIHQFGVKGSGALDSISASCAGDVNRDGHPDLLVGFPAYSGTGTCWVYSGQSGAVLYQLNGSAANMQFGYSVSDAGDLNQDGFADFVIGGSSIAAIKGSATVFSGIDASILYEWTGKVGTDRFGFAVRRAGDVNADGTEDLIIGAPSYSTGGGGFGKAYVYSGSNGSLLFELGSSVLKDQFGSAVAAAGDVNGDGHSDLIVGAPYGANLLGQAFVFSGASGALLYSYVGEANKTQLKAVSGGGDINRDGLDDFLISSHLGGFGSVLVYSGYDGSLIRRIDGNVEDDYGYSLDGAKDCNGDTIPDLFTGNPNGGRSEQEIGIAHLVSGADGTSLTFFTGLFASALGTSMASAGDVDADGVDDLLIGAPRIAGSESSTGEARIHSGRDGTLLRMIIGESDSNRFGAAVSSAGDVNQDRFADVIVGASQDNRIAEEAGSATVFSGRDGSILLRFDGDSEQDRLGSSVSFTTDWNHDGIPDLLVGAPQDDRSGINSGSVFAYSGNDGALIRTFAGPSSFCDFGIKVANAGDVNGDGLYDCIIGAPRDDKNGHDSGTVFVYSGADGSLLLESSGSEANDNFGAAVSGAGDLNGDGASDLLVGAPYHGADRSYRGMVRVISGNDGLTLYELIGLSDNAMFGQDVSGFHDVNVDGVADLLIGDSEGNSAGNLVGSARLYSGRTGRLLYYFEGRDAEEVFGAAVALVCDLNGDSHPDIMIGAPKNDADAGAVFVYAGNDLFLQANERRFFAGDTAILSSRGGAPGAPVALFIVEVNGSVAQGLIAVGSLDSGGDWVIQATVPSGFSGMKLGLQSFSIGPSGWVINSATADVTLE